MATAQTALVYCETCRYEWEAFTVPASPARCPVCGAPGEVRPFWDESTQRERYTLRPAEPAREAR